MSRKTVEVVTHRSLVNEVGHWTPIGEATCWCRGTWMGVVDTRL